MQRCRRLDNPTQIHIRAWNPKRRDQNMKSCVHSFSQLVRRVYHIHLYIIYTIATMPTASSSTSRPKTKTSREKPYDRTLSSSYTSLKPSTETGAPATHGQKTRKGKKAWRKNIDLRDEEEALETAREEERVTG